MKRVLLSCALLLSVAAFLPALAVAAEVAPDNPVAMHQANVDAIADAAFHDYQLRTTDDLAELGELLAAPAPRAIGAHLRVVHAVDRGLASIRTDRARYWRALRDTRSSA